jgi:hypothetical protein
VPGGIFLGMPDLKKHGINGKEDRILLSVILKHPV